VNDRAPDSTGADSSVTRTDEDAAPDDGAAAPQLLRWFVVAAGALLIPVLPFLALGDGFEERIHDWLTGDRSCGARFGLVAGVLSTDILLPVPSSAVSTWAGGVLGVGWGTAASWLGMTVGATLGFALAHWLGRPLALRMARRDDLARMARTLETWGVLALVLTRPVPVFAEACVLLTGTMNLSWRRFLPAVVLANLAISLVYAGFGAFARSHDALSVALGGVVIVPVAVLFLLRRLSRNRPARPG
jgi:uncharacterized membrane protein YdjX (TVP38/TMEM64 family)